MNYYSINRGSDNTPFCHRKGIHRKLPSTLIPSPIGADLPCGRDEPGANTGRADERRQDVANPVTKRTQSGKTVSGTAPCACRARGGKHSCRRGSRRAQTERRNGENQTKVEGRGQTYQRIMDSIVYPYMLSCELCM